MKSLLCLIFSLITLQTYCQSSEYPKYYIQDGDTVGVIYSIEQVQKIYNNQILLDLFKDVRLGCDSLVKRYFVVVNKYEQKQLVDKLLIDQYEKSLSDKKEEVNTLITKTNNLEVDIKKCDEQKNLQSGQITNYQTIVEQLNKERKWLLGGTIGFGALSLFLLGTFVGN